MTWEGGGGRGRSASRIRERIEEEGQNALLSVGALRERSARALLAEMVGESLDRRVDLREQATVPMQLLELVRFCTRCPDGLSALARKLPMLDPGCPQAVLVRRLADEWTAVDSLDGLPEITDSWDFLTGTLGALTMSHEMRTALVRAATHARVAAPPTHAENPWHDFLHMAGQGAPRDGLPPWMLYLDRSTDSMNHLLAGEVLARNRKWALRCGLAQLLDMERTQRLRSPTAPVRPHQEFLAIHITPDPLDSESYTVSHSFMSTARGPHWEQGDALPQVPRDGLEEAVSGIVRSVEGAAGDRPADLWLEFVLPFELLNLPVDWWPRDTTESPHVPLAVDYPVVIRSLDRLQNSAWHRFWRHRWLQLSLGEPPAQSLYVHAVGGDGGHLRGLEARLGDNQQVVATVLSEPPLPGQNHGRRELEAALRSGLPVVIWHRTDRSTQEFLDVVRTLLAEGWQRLPAKVAAYRRQAAIHDGDDRDGHHPGRHLTLLWDDPDRKPVVPDGRGWP
ncbi:hypothetical protein ACIQUP_20415 [Streptomyces nigra]|uniref:VMAP-C domain-containing protein n=1 Tax=Streptomyces nigra TaxID=1827580 RepID=UPI0038299E2B